MVWDTFQYYCGYLTTFIGLEFQILQYVTKNMFLKKLEKYIL